MGKPLARVDITSFGDEVAFVNIVLFDFVGDTCAGGAFSLGFFAFVEIMPGVLTARGDGAPAHDFLDHGTQDGKLWGVGRFGHAVAAHAVDLFLQPGLPFRMQAHDEQIGHQGRGGSEQACKSEHADNIGTFLVI